MLRESGWRDLPREALTLTLNHILLLFAQALAAVRKRRQNSTKTMWSFIREGYWGEGLVSANRRVKGRLNRRPLFKRESLCMHTEYLCSRATHDVAMPCRPFELSKYLPMFMESFYILLWMWKLSITFFSFQKKWCEYFILSNLHTFELWSLNSLHLSDLSDEPLLKNIAFYYENENAQGINLLNKTHQLIISDEGF